MLVGFGERDGGVAVRALGCDASTIPARAVTGRAMVHLAGIINHRIRHWKHRQNSRMIASIVPEKRRIKAPDSLPSSR